MSAIINILYYRDSKIQAIKSCNKPIVADLTATIYLLSHQTMTEY